MNKLLLLLIMLTTFTNVSYASFPVTDTLEIKQETVQTENLEKNHSSLIKMGFDLNSCKCESCRNGIVPLTNNVEGKEVLKKNIWIRILIIMTILSILLWSWAVNFNKSFGV